MNEFRKPVHPGKILFEDTIVPFGLTVAEVACILDIPLEALLKFLNEEISCSPQMAAKIARITSINAETWLAMQTEFDLWKAGKRAA